MGDKTPVWICLIFSLLPEVEPAKVVRNSSSPVLHRLSNSLGCLKANTSVFPGPFFCRLHSLIYLFTFIKKGGITLFSIKCFEFLNLMLVGKKPFFNKLVMLADRSVRVNRNK